MELASANPSFYRVIRMKLDITNIIKQELRDILYGKIPRNFVINIKGGLIGRQTGVFKSAFGCQLALELDPTFNVKERVGLTYEMLLQKIRKYAKRKQIFLLDERVRDFKMSAELRLANIIESCRERQLCFILCGVPELHFTFSDYHFERLGESSDDYMNKVVTINGEKILTGQKTVAFLVKKITESKKNYRGYIKHNITSLEDKKWRKFWAEYMLLKREHQQKAVVSELTAFDFKKEAQALMNSKEFNDCFKEDKLIRGVLRNLIYSKYPDNTKEEREMIYWEILRHYK